MESIKTYEIIWQQIKIRITYHPMRWSVIDHLEIESIDPPHAPLPITETGYRSHFENPAQVSALGGPVNFVQGWLAEQEATPDWQDYLERSRQGELF